MTQQPPPQGSQPPPPDSEPQQPQTQGSLPLPDGEPQHTTPLWFGGSREQTQRFPITGSPDPTERMPQYPAYPPAAPQPATEPVPAAFVQPGAQRTASARPRRLAELGIVALLAAVLASTGTYAATRGDIAASPVVQSATSSTRTGADTTAAPVSQANPSAPNWSVTAAAVSPSVVAISVTGSQGSGKGSGVIFDTRGHILTNNHVVAAGGQGAQLSVTLSDQRRYDATIVGTDPSTDLAVIKLTNGPTDLKAIALGDANALKVGEPVMAVGNPLGLAGTVTTGIVSALNRPVSTSPSESADQFGQQSSSEAVVTNAIQTSAAINPGNSGGALVNAGGQLIGINSSIASLGSSDGSSSQSGNIGIGFAIPVNEARSIASQLIASGKAAHAYLGVGSKDGVVTEGSAKRAAAVLTSVASGTPADKADLKDGDAIIAIDGDAIDGSLSLIGQVRGRTAGDKVTLTVLRDGQSKSVSVTLASKPETNP